MPRRGRAIRIAARLNGTRANDRASHARGFVLPLTLWIVAAVGLVVISVNEWVKQAIDNAQAVKQRADIKLAMTDIQNEIVFLLGTRPMTYRGLEIGIPLEEIDRTNATALMTADFETDRYIRLDGTPYSVQSHEGYVLRLYDGRGLLNVNSPSAPYLRRLLGLFNLPEPARNEMVDSLEDYIDSDDLNRLSGAEERDYLRLGRTAPANALLMTPMEAQYVMGWDLAPELWRQDLERPLLTTCGVTGFNPNTASREAILSAFPNLLEDDIQAILERRAERPFRNIREFAAAANTIVADDPFFYTFAPSACIIGEITHVESRERTRFSLTIDNLNAKTRPWRIDYAFPIPSKSSAADREAVPEAVFPAPDALDADERERAEAGQPRQP